jgi:hypothetical protein
MKTLLLLTLSALVASGQTVQSAVQTVQGGFAYSAPLSSLTIRNTTAGNLLATVCGSPVAVASDLTSVTDSTGGTWTSAGPPALPYGYVVKTYDSGGNPIEWWEMSEFIVWVYYRYSPGGDVTVNFNGTFPGCTAMVLTEFSPPPPTSFLTLPTFNQFFHSCQHFYPQAVYASVTFGPAPNAYLYGGVLCEPGGLETTAADSLAVDPPLPGWSNPDPSWFSASGR